MHLSKIIVGVICFISFRNLCAQDACGHIPEGKVAKWLENSKDTKKYEADERMGFLEKAVDEDPACMQCLHRMGELQFLRAKRSGASFDAAKATFTRIVEQCPDYHSEPYYYLGAMQYADREFESALKNFEKFLRFPDDDPSKFEKDYQKKYKEVEEVLPTVKAYAEIYSHHYDYHPRKVSGVSSEGDDYLPFISPDGEIMFYTRVSMRQNKGDYAPYRVEEFTWSKRPDINANFDNGQALPRPFNLGDNYGGATISVDNKELIIAKKNPTKTNPQNIDLYSTRYRLGSDPVSGQPIYTWDTLHLLEGTNINTDNWESQPSLSGDGRTLFFVSIRPEGLADKNGQPSHDIYYSQKQSNNQWGPAKLLPGNINTKGQEKTPFMHSDSHTLYFSSDGHIGVGKMDLYYCKMKPDGTFSEPKNLGAPINTEQDELGLVVSSDGELAYFGAQNFQGDRGWNIYEFKMPEIMRPEKVMVLKGTVKNDEGNPPADAQVEIKYAQSGEKEKIQINSDDGTYAAIVNLNKKEDVVVSVQGEGLAFNSRVIARKSDTHPAVVTKLNMDVPEEKPDKPFEIHDIIYTTGSASIEEDSKLILDEFADYLKLHTELKINILGHTDNIGDPKSNLALSKERAYEVLKYLASKGVDGARMKYEGYGDSKPRASNDSEEGRKLNRRTEFVIQKTK